jgi:dinuclear metal center YbgI/SA1388 family protein
VGKVTVADIMKIIEHWAPPWTAWERDNVGLQIGRRDQPVSKILVALEVTDRIAEEAIRNGTDLIITHHPLLFHPASKITDVDQTGRNILALVQNDIAVYSAHTNLDFSSHGVSYALAEVLDLEEVRFLAPIEAKMNKVVVYVPRSHVEQVTQAMSEAGGGIIGNYESCSFRTEGTGTFRGNRASNPVIGKKGSLEFVNEVRLEMIAPEARARSIVRAIKQVHPYEEVAYDLYPVHTPSANYGMGAVGTLRRETSLGTFLNSCKKKLGCRSIRYTGNLHQKVRTIAVCGGSGSDLLDVAIDASAEVFVTADVRYHTFHAADGRIALADAGHWETEHVILEPLRRKLQKATHGLKHKVSVTMTQYSTNPVHSI